MEYTIEENKKRQKNIKFIKYTDKKQVKVYLWFYKLGRLSDNKSLTFENDERALIHIENLIKTTDYDLISFSTEEKTETSCKKYYIGLRK